MGTLVANWGVIGVLPGYIRGIQGLYTGYIR